jgi:hypothetical protein
MGSAKYQRDGDPRVQPTEEGIDHFDVPDLQTRALDEDPTTAFSRAG